MSEKTPRHPGKVLVMDDDQLVLETARLILQRLGFDAVLAADGQEALALYQQHLTSDYPVDVVILDLIVRGGTGAVETAALILEVDPAACLVVASGATSDPVMTKFRNHGFRASIAKPFDVAGLGMLVGELLD